MGEKHQTTFVVANEDYERLVRLVEGDQHPRVELDLAVTVSDKDQDAFNVVAEIPGVDPALKDQVVMIGGHFDSWHTGTGATAA